MAFRSQDQQTDVYVQDVMTHPDHRNCGVARALLGAVRRQAEQWGCRRMYLTSEPDSTAAHQTWLALGLGNIASDFHVGHVSVLRDYKGPGKDRAVYECLLVGGDSA
jgi:GNAT superfamily N-acetyltransferase